jgi:hypothetical protein
LWPWTSTIAFVGDHKVIKGWSQQAFLVNPGRHEAPHETTQRFLATAQEPDVITTPKTGRRVLIHGVAVQNSPILVAAQPTGIKRPESTRRSRRPVPLNKIGDRCDAMAFQFLG